MRARQYDPTIGRFLSPDPLGDGYLYAHNNPVAYTDPSGLIAWDPLLADVAEGAGYVSAGAGIAAVGLGATGIGAPVAAALGAVALSSGAVSLGADAIAAVGTCTGGKGGCASTFAEAGVAAAAGRFPGGRSIVKRAPSAAEESGAAARGPRAVCNCFPAGTKVATEAGEMPIEKVKVGDKVWAQNLTTGKRELRKVVGLFNKHTDELMTLTVAGATIDVTSKHPFYVPGRGWVMSGELKIGDKLLQRDGTVVAITALSHRSADTTVYNFEVEGDHNYYIGEAQLLVHNCEVIPGNPFRGPNAPKDAFKHLDDKHGIDPNDASNRLHVIKEGAGLGAADDVVIGRTGDVYDARTGEWLDTLTNPGLGTSR
jgi:hypothetical protein